MRAPAFQAAHGGIDGVKLMFAGEHIATPQEVETNPEGNKGKNGQQAHF